MFLLDDKNIDFPLIPQITDDIDIHKLPYGAGIFFKGGIKPIIIRGQKSYDIINFLDASFKKELTTKEILENVPSQVTIEDVSRTLLKLYSQGLIQNKQESSSNKDEKFWNRYTHVNKFIKDSSTINKILNSNRILIVGNDLMLPLLHNTLNLSAFNNISSVILGERINDFEMENISKYFQLTTKESYDEFLTYFNNLCISFRTVIVSVRRFSRKILLDLNKVCIENNVEFLPIYENGTSIELGPYNIPFQTACINCTQIMKHSEIENGLYNWMIDSEEPFGYNSSNLIGENINSYLVIFNFLMIELTKILTDHSNSILTSRQVIYNPIEGSFESNGVFKNHECEICGNL